MSDASTGTGMLECVSCRKAQRSCWRWTPMGRILSRLPHTTWSRIRTCRPLPVRSRLSIDASSCAKPVPKKTKALAHRLGTPVLECFLAFYRLVVFFLVGRNRLFFKGQHVVPFDRPIGMHHDLFHQQLDHCWAVLKA